MSGKPRKIPRAPNRALVAAAEISMCPIEDLETFVSLLGPENAAGLFTLLVGRFGVADARTMLEGIASAIGANKPRPA